MPRILPGEARRGTAAAVGTVEPSAAEPEPTVDEVEAQIAQEPHDAPEPVLVSRAVDPEDLVPVEASRIGEDDVTHAPGW